jgi:hypothetical protein
MLSGFLVSTAWHILKTDEGVGFQILRVTASIVTE